MPSELRAYVLFTGGMIGVGFFGLPYVVSRAGLFPSLTIGALVLALVYFLHLLYAEVVTLTGGRRRLPGYAGVYLGPWGSGLASLGNLPGLLGALLAYLILGSAFLELLLRAIADVPAGTGLALYTAAVGAFLLLPLRQLPWLQLAVLTLFGATLLAITGATATHARFDHLPLLHEPSALLLPYGVLLFSFWGLSLVPELVELTGRDLRRTRRVLLWGFLTASVTYVLFALLVAGTSGPTTTEDAFTGLAPFVGPGVILLGALFGFLTTFDSFLALGRTFADTCTLDLHVRPLLARFLAVLVPLGLYVAGIQTFVRVLAVTGAVFLGIEGLAVTAIAATALRRSSPTRATRLRPALLLAASLLFVGVVNEILTVFATP